jgi:DNA-binding transcriptional LysR family regulator
MNIVQGPGVQAMRIDFLGLQAFVSIAERGSFQRAAAHLNLSQTALSHRIRKLEDDLGAQLFTRTTREVTLTHTGADLLPKARRAINEIAASLSEIRDAGQPEQELLSLGCLPTIATNHLPDLIRRFQDRHPDVRVRIHDNSATEIGELVSSGVAEFGLTIVAANSWDLHTQTLLRESFLLVCRNDHPLAAAREVDWDGIVDTPLIRVSPQTGNRQLIDDALGARREMLKWRYEVQHIATAVSLVEAGVGATIIPKLALNLRLCPTLRGVTLRNPSLTRSLGIVSKRDKPLSPLATQFRSMIVKHFAKQSKADARLS